MALKVGTTDDAKLRNFIAIYGASGVGKTSLLVSLDQYAQAKGGRALQIDFDDGNKCLVGKALPSVFCEYLDDLYQVLTWVRDDPNWQLYNSIFIDGMTVLAENLLHQHLNVNSNKQKAYGDYANDFLVLVKFLKTAFKDRTIVCTFQEKKVQDDQNKIYQSINLPGRVVGPEMPYKFDEVLCLRILPDAEGKPARVLQAQPDMTYTAKDRSGKLDIYNPADLQHVLNRIEAV